MGSKITKANVANVRTTTDLAVLFRVFGDDAETVAFLDRHVDADSLTDERPAASVHDLPPSRKARQEARKAVREDYAAELERYMLRAEAETQGVFLNEAGKRRGIVAVTLVNTPPLRFERWASEEFREFVERNAFPTFEAWCDAAGVGHLFRAVA